MKLVSVDNDPFASSSGLKLSPVDGDPFAAAGAPKLAPVDHDPFSASPRFPGDAPGGVADGQFPPLVADGEDKAASADPDLEAYYGATGRIQRITDPLKAGVAQARQATSALGADVASRHLDTFERARTTAPGRPIVPNADGSVSTERSITVTDPRINGGRPTNIPTMFGGQPVADEEAIERIVVAGGKDPETGRALEGFGSIDEAVASARARSDALGASQGGVPMGGMIRAMRQQSTEQAEQTRAELQGKVGKSISGVIEQGDRIAGLSVNPAVRDMFASKTFGEAIGHFWRDPLGAVQAISLQSLPAMVPALVAGATTGPAGGAVTMGATSYLQEYASSVIDALGESGVNVRDQAQLEAAFRNPELMSQVRERARTRAAIIGGTDAATMGVAGRMLLPRIGGGRVAREVANVPAQMAAQGTAGGGAEAVAQLATEGAVNRPGEVVAEVVGEAGGAPVEVAAVAGTRGRTAPVEPRAQPVAPQEPGVSGWTLTPVDGNPFADATAADKPAPALQLAREEPETGGPNLFGKSLGEVAQMVAETRAQEQAALVEAFGSEELANRYRRLETLRHSAASQVDSDRHEAAFQQMVAGLPPERAALLDRIGTADEIERVRQAMQETEFAPETPVDAVASEAAHAARRLNAGDLEAVMSGNAPLHRQENAIRFARAFGELRARGLGDQDIRARVVHALRQAGFGDDAAFVFDGLTALMERARAAAVRSPVPRPSAAPPGTTLPAIAESRVPQGGSAQPVSEKPASAGQAEPIVNELAGLSESRQNMTPGAAYVGNVPDIWNPAVPRATGEPVRREKIIADVLRDLRASLYEGRIKGKATLGFYRKGIEEIRTKNVGDIETFAHEVAHMLDDRIPEIRAQWLPGSKANAAVRGELSGVSYDRKKLFEGFAEFVRLWMTQEQAARTRAPNFHAWFESFIARHRYGPTLRQAQGRMHAWFAQSALDRARSKIGYGGDVNEALNGLFDRFRQSTLDDLHGIMRMEREVTGGLAAGGAYETARLVRGKAALIEGMLTLGAPKVRRDGSHTFAGKSLKQILDPVSGKLDDFLLYAVGRSAGELMQQGREHLFTRSEIAAMRSLETPEFKKAFTEYQVWNEAVLDFAQAKGVINPVARQFWRRAEYLPFHRVGQGGGFASVPGDWKGIKALTGGTDNIRPVLQNIIGNAAMLVDAALTNEARQRVAELAGRQGGARFMARIPTEDRKVQVHAQEVERAILDALGVSNKAALPPPQQAFVDQIISSMAPFAEFVLRGQAPVGRNVVAVLTGGKPDYYEVADPVLYRALTSLNRKPAEWLVRMLSIPRRIGQASITLSMDFMAANFVRDTLMGWVMSRHGFKPFLDGVRGMKSRIAADPAYRDFIANGGGFSSHLLDERSFRTHMERFYKGKGIDYRTVLDAPAKMLLALERVADAFEAATRLGEFRNAVGRGEHPRHAAYSAREVSTDFGMRGDSQAIGFLYDTIIFLKAAVNSLDRFGRGVAHDPNRATIAAKTALIGLLSAGLYALNYDNELYDQLEDWDRDANWHFFVPRPEALEAERRGEPLPIEQRYLHFRLPKIWEVGAVGSIAERTLEAFLKGVDKDTAGKFLKVIGGVFGFEYIPQAVEPIAELAMNKERFTNRPIEPTALQELAPWARATPATSMTMRKLGEATRDLPRSLQLSPAQMEHLLKGYLNTWAMYGLAASDAAFFNDVRPASRTDQLPVVRRFFSEEPARSTRFVSELYKAIDEATEVRRTMRHMDRTWRPQVADEMENTTENRLYGQLQRADDRMRVFRAEAEKVIGAPTLRDVQKFALERSRTDPQLWKRANDSGVWSDLQGLKRFLLDDLTRERNQYARDVVTDVRARRTEMQGAR